MGGLHYRLMRSSNLQDWVPPDDWLAPDSVPVSVTAESERASWLVFPPSDALTQFFKLSIMDQ